MALRDWAERNREFVIILISFVVITILSVAAMKISGSGNGEKKERKAQTELEVDPKVAQTVGDGDSAKPRSSNATVGGYFTEITPEAIIAQAQVPSAISPLPENPEKVQMPVGWFVYFSSTEVGEGGVTTVTLDTDENGFGTVIICPVDYSVYPQFQKMKSGKKLWVAGHIQNVNLEGTGTINLEADHFRFDGHTHVALFPDEEG